MTKFENSVKQIIRVNHAGEYGAQKIYNGQIRFCKNSKLKKKLEKYLAKKKFTLITLMSKLLNKELDQP